MTNYLYLIVLKHKAIKLINIFLKRETHTMKNKAQKLNDFIQKSLEDNTQVFVQKDQTITVFRPPVFSEEHSNEICIDLDFYDFFSYSPNIEQDLLEEFCENDKSESIPELFKSYLNYLANKTNLLDEYRDQAIDDIQQKVNDATNNAYFAVLDDIEFETRKGNR